MEKVLKSGKKIEVKELTALEEVLSYQLMGKEFDPDNVIPSAMLHRSVCAVLSLQSIDDAPIVTPSTLNEAYKTLNTFSKKEWREVLEVYNEINEDDDPETLGE